MAKTTHKPKRTTRKRAPVWVQACRVSSPMLPGTLPTLADKLPPDTPARTLTDLLASCLSRAEALDSQIERIRGGLFGAQPVGNGVPAVNASSTFSSALRIEDHLSSIEKTVAEISSQL